MKRRRDDECVLLCSDMPIYTCKSSEGIKEPLSILMAFHEYCTWISQAREKEGTRERNNISGKMKQLREASPDPRKPEPITAIWWINLILHSETCMAKTYLKIKWQTESMPSGEVSSVK